MSEIDVSPAIVNIAWLEYKATGTRRAGKRGARDLDYALIKFRDENMMD